MLTQIFKRNNVSNLAEHPDSDQSACNYTVQDVT